MAFGEIFFSCDTAGSSERARQQRQFVINSESFEIFRKTSSAGEFLRLSIHRGPKTSY